MFYNINLSNKDTRVHTIKGATTLSIMTFSIMKFSITIYQIQLSINNKQNIGGVAMLSVIYDVCRLC